MKLRPYQKDAVDSIGSSNVIIKMPTGSGKTLVACEFCLQGLKSRQVGKPQAALFLVPTKDLVSQVSSASTVLMFCKDVPHHGQSKQVLLRNGSAEHIMFSNTAEV